ncbi:MAG: PrsW family intramembrane metalloprotease [Deltaproteobacteria bacterium]|nr:PrsW family intramembrane metalloprotease [Deltaproteobacteria bacterium]
MSLLSLASIPCAVIPILCFLWFMWWLDRYDREPIWLFLGVFLWGAVGAVGLALFGSSLASIPVDILAPPGTAQSLGMTFVAPLVEEPAKAIVLLLVARSRHFDNVTDGFVYGAAAGLGFGMSENILYFMRVAAEGDPLAWAATVTIRTLYSALMHAGATSLVGAALGIAKFRRGAVRPLLLAAGFAGAMGMHALWNGLLSLASDGAGMLGALNFALFPLEFAALVAIFQLCLLFEHRVIRRELEDEAARGTLPEAHVRMLSAYLLRWRRGWLPKGVDHDEYVRQTTTLALRKSQLATGKDSEFYEREIAELRTGIARVLAAGGVQS